MTPPDAVAKAELAEAFSTLARLLPEGMTVTVYRPENDRRVAVESVYPDGARTRYYADQAAN